MYIPANTIDEVLDRLEQVITAAVQKEDRVGYFASLYYKVTTKVKDGIHNNEFEDGHRMETLDVVFANRFLTALYQWQNKLPLSDSWKIAFTAAEKSSLLVLHHLLLGINAHINLDLGIAAVQTMGDGKLEAIRKDFNAINAILASMISEIMQDINRVSPLTSLMGLHANNNTSILLQFSISNARDGAWCFAEELCKQSKDDSVACISRRDADISKLAYSLVHSHGLMRVTLWFIHLFEWRRPKKIINVLYKQQKVFIKAAMLIK